MKKKSLLFTAAALILLCSCGKDETPEPATQISQPTEEVSTVIELGSVSLLQEGWVRVPDLDTDGKNFSPDYGIGLSCLAKGDSLTVFSNRLGSIIETDATLHYEYPMSDVDSCMVIAEPVSNDEGYGCRVIYLFRVYESAGLPKNIRYTSVNGDKTDVRAPMDTEIPELKLTEKETDPYTLITQKNEGKVTVTERIPLAANMESVHYSYNRAAEQLYRDGLRKLYEDGIIPEGTEESPLSFDQKTLEPVFTSAENELKLSVWYRKDNSCFVLADQDFSVYANIISGEDSDEAEKSEEYPVFLPVSNIWNNHPLDYEYYASQWYECAGSFADSSDAIRYMVMYKDYISRIDEGYYMGDTDRLCLTTLVFVIDVQTGEIVHLKYVGSDVPESSTYDSSGNILVKEAENYIRSILK